MAVRLDRDKFDLALPFIRDIDNMLLRAQVVPYPLNLTEDPDNPLYDHDGALDIYWFMLLLYKKKWYLFFNWGAGPLPKNGGLAISEDGKTFETYDNYILPLGPSGAWDDNYVELHTILRVGNRWRLYYGGQDGTAWRIGFAEAERLTGPWTKYAGNPVFDLGAPGQWDDDNVADPHVYWFGGRFHLYYNGGPLPPVDIGHATSLDGVNWTRDPANPVITRTGAGTWAEATRGISGVLLIGGGLMLISHGRDAAGIFRIGISGSTDGSSFTDHPANTIFEATQGEGQMFHPEILLDHEMLYVYYTNRPAAGQQAVYRAYTRFIP